MTWKVSLPMYNVSPRLRRGYDALLAALLAQAELGTAVDAVPETDFPAHWPDFWTRPDLLLSQTCGYPYVTGLRGRVTLIATPAFDVPGCAGSDYASVLVARAGSGIRSLADARGRVAAVNEPHSHSGMNALRHAAAPLACDGRFFAAVRWSGSHAASARLVRDGGADIAALDCVTYALLRDEHPAAVAGLVPVGWTAAAPGLPFIAGGAVPDAVVRRLRGVLLSPGAALRDAMAAVRIRGFAYRSDADYERIAAMEAEARGLAYPSLEAPPTPASTNLPR